MLRRFGFAGLVVGAVFLLGAPAWAHVTISPPSAPKGSDAVLSFNVPNESETASTTEVEIGFPADHPIASAAILPIPGWTAKVTTVKVDKQIQTDEGPVTEAVSLVTWSGGTIEPGQFQQFTVSVGLPADADSLEFKAKQTYSDGTVVRWIEPETASGAEPDHPAPVLTLTAAGAASPSTTTATAPTGNGTTSSKNAATKDDVDSAKSLSVVAIIVGALGLVVGLVAFVLGRRPRTS